MRTLKYLQSVQYTCTSAVQVVNKEMTNARKLSDMCKKFVYQKVYVEVDGNDLILRIPCYPDGGQVEYAEQMQKRLLRGTEPMERFEMKHEMTDEQESELDELKWLRKESLQEDIDLRREEFNDAARDLREEMKDDIKELKESWGW